MSRHTVEERLLYAQGALEDTVEIVLREYDVLKARLRQAERVVEAAREMRPQQETVFLRERALFDALAAYDVVEETKA